MHTRRSLNSRDSFPRRKFKNRAQTSCSPGPILSSPTISFDLHAKVADEIDLEMCSYGQLSEVQMLHDLDLGLGQGHITIHSTCRTTSMTNHVTVASHSTEIWPFKFRAKVQVQYYHHQSLVLNFTQNGSGDRPRKGHFW